MKVSQATQWYIFFKDNLLIQKNANGNYSIPFGIQPPIAPSDGQRIHRVLLPTGIYVFTFMINYPIAETNLWLMKGLRASFDYLALDDYRAAGKAYQILYWDQHSRYCPVCGTATKQHTDIMKKCPQCGFIKKNLKLCLFLLLHIKCILKAFLFQGLIFGKRP